MYDRYGTAIACIELAAIKLAIILSDTWRATRYPYSMVQIDVTVADSIASSSSLRYIQIGTTARHRIATSFSIKVDIDLGDRSSPTILTLIVQSLPFTLSKRLLLLILKV